MNISIEKLKEAYGDQYEKALPFMDEDGWVSKEVNNIGRYLDVEGFEKKSETHHQLLNGEMVYYDKFRPISLRQ
jgi:hypothetical protein